MLILNNITGANYEIPELGFLVCAYDNYDISYKEIGALQVSTSILDGFTDNILTLYDGVTTFSGTDAVNVLLNEDIYVNRIQFSRKVVAEYSEVNPTVTSIGDTTRFPIGSICLYRNAGLTLVGIYQRFGSGGTDWKKIQFEGSGNQYSGGWTGGGIINYHWTDDDCAANDWVKLQHLSWEGVGYVTPYPLKIREFAVSCATSTTGTTKIDLYVNGVFVVSLISFVQSTSPQTVVSSFLLANGVDNGISIAANSTISIRRNSLGKITKVLASMYCERIE